MEWLSYLSFVVAQEPYTQERLNEGTAIQKRQCQASIPAD
jgi:hypothetical protein